MAIPVETSRILRDVERSRQKLHLVDSAGDRQAIARETATSGAVPGPARRTTATVNSGRLAVRQASL